MFKKVLRFSVGILPKRCFTRRPLSIVRNWAGAGKNYFVANLLTQWCPKMTSMSYGNQIQLCLFLCISVLCVCICVYLCFPQFGCTLGTRFGASIKGNRISGTSCLIKNLDNFIRITS